MSTKPPSKKTPIHKATVTGLADSWIEVFKVGTHTSSKGKQQTFTQSDIDQMIVNHQLGAAPAVLGHPEHDAPAYAWVDQYKRDGDSLFAKFKDINPAFENGVKTGAYRNRSVSVYPDKACGWRVRHVGWLGAMAPAIDGLSTNFSVPDEESFEFTAPGYSLVWGLESAATLLRKLRDRMIEKDGLEAADTTLPQWSIDSMTEAATTARAEFNDDKPNLFNQPTGVDDMTISQADHDAAIARARTEGETAGRTAAVTDMVPKSDFAAKEQELLTFKKAAQKLRIDAFIHDWKAKGVIVPAEEAGLAEYMAQQEDGGAEFTFSKDGADGKKTPAQFFLDFMAARKPVVKIGGNKTEPEDAIDGTNPQALADAAQTYMKEQSGKGLTVTLPEAVAYAASHAAKA